MPIEDWSFRRVAWTIYGALFLGVVLDVAACNCEVDSHVTEARRGVFSCNIADGVDAHDMILAVSTSDTWTESGCERTIAGRSVPCLGSCVFAPKPESKTVGLAHVRCYRAGVEVFEAWTPRSSLVVEHVDGQVKVEANYSSFHDTGWYARGDCSVE